MTTHTVEPIATSINNACLMTGLGRTTLYALINSKKIDTVKLGRRTLVKTASLRRLLGDA
ncbi:MAG: DNA-binding protein [Chitinophagaceae bacterium]|nr:MAG: DNA-binding protein [Chitinophagaceae bacterium]